MVRLALNETKVNVYSGNFLKSFFFLNLNQWENKGKDSETITPKFVLSTLMCFPQPIIFSHFEKFFACPKRKGELRSSVFQEFIGDEWFCTCGMTSRHQPQAKSPGIRFVKWQDTGKNYRGVLEATLEATLSFSVIFYQERLKEDMNHPTQLILALYFTE